MMLYTPHKLEYIRKAYTHSADAVSFDDLQAWADELHVTIHIAVMQEPYLSKICSGKKYIESRITTIKVPPFGRAAAGDIIFLKRSGGAIAAMASIERAEFLQLGSPVDLKKLAEKYSLGLGFESGYIESKHEANFASLLWLSDVHLLPARALKKKNRLTWITINPRP